MKRLGVFIFLMLFGMNVVQAETINPTTLLAGAFVDICESDDPKLQGACSGIVIGIYLASSRAHQMSNRVLDKAVSSGKPLEAEDLPLLPRCYETSDDLHVLKEWILNAVKDAGETGKRKKLGDFIYPALVMNYDCMMKGTKGFTAEK